MATGTHTVVVPVDVQAVWDYVSDLEKWATTVPAYKEHEIINDKQSIWTFEGSVKGIKKTIQAQVDITEWNEPSNIKFELKGLSDNFTGSGHFTAEDVNGKTIMTCTVEIHGACSLPGRSSLGFRLSPDPSGTTGQTTAATWRREA